MMQAAGDEYSKIWHMFAFRPQATQHLARFTQEILREPGPFTPGFRELIAAYTSAKNDCLFWLKSHAAVAAVLLEQEADAAGIEGFCGERLVEAVIQDLEGSPLPEREKTLLRFVRKVNHDSVGVTPADIAPLHAAGWTDEAIYYAITICALFNFYNRWVDAGGVPALSDEAHRQNAKRSAAIGYVRK
jgi:uncharacterized peroxidase-related enzyme